AIAVCPGARDRSLCAVRVRAAEIKAANIIETVGCAWLHVPAKSQIDGQPRRGVPVCLAIESPILLSQCWWRLAVGRPDPDLAGAQQHGGRAVPRLVRIHCTDSSAGRVDHLPGIAGEGLHCGCGASKIDTDFG